MMKRSCIVKYIIYFLNIIISIFYFFCFINSIVCNLYNFFNLAVQNFTYF